MVVGLPWMVTLLGAAGVFLYIFCCKMENVRQTKLLDDSLTVRWHRTT